MINVQISGWTRLLENNGPVVAAGGAPKAPPPDDFSAQGIQAPDPQLAHGTGSGAALAGAAPTMPAGWDPSLLDGVTPEVILSLVRLRMDDVDMQIQNRSEEILRSTDRANELSNQLQALEAIKAKTVSQGGSDPSIEYENADADDAHLVQLNGQSLTVAEVAGQYDLSADLEGLEKSGKIKASALGDLVESRRQELQRANSGNEIKMMELQQLMQRRAEIVSLGSNLLRTLHDATQQIIRNLGA